MHEKTSVINSFRNMLLDISSSNDERKDIFKTPKLLPKQSLFFFLQNTIAKDNQRIIKIYNIIITDVSSKSGTTETTLNPKKKSDDIVTNDYNVVDPVETLMNQRMRATSSPLQIGEISTNKSDLNNTKTKKGKL